MTTAAATEGVCAAAGTGPRAMHEAASAATAGIEGTPGLLLGFASNPADAGADARALLAASDGGPSAGMTGSGLIGPGGRLDEGAVAIAFSNTVRAGVGCRRDVAGELHRAGAEATEEALDSLSGPARALMLFLDSSCGDMAESIAGAYTVAGPGLPLSGGAASGKTRGQFHGGEAGTESVIVIAIGSDDAVAVGMAQSCSFGSSPALVTRSEGQYIHEIGGAPAAAVYLEALGMAGAEVTDDEFEAISMIHPIAQLELHADPRLRHVLGRRDDGSLLVGSHVPTNSPIEFVKLGNQELLESARESVTSALSGMPGETARAGVVFDCAGRRQALQGELDAEIDEIISAFGSPSPALAGLYTNGEVARIRGSRGDRNHAIVTVAFG